MTLHRVHAHYARAMQAMFAQVLLKPFSVCDSFTSNKKIYWWDRMSSQVLRVIAALVSWSMFSSSWRASGAAEGDAISDVPFKLWSMLSACSLTVCVYCRSLMDIGDFAAFYCMMVTILLLSVSYLVPNAFAFLVALLTFLYAFFGCIQSCSCDSGGFAVVSDGARVHCLGRLFC